MNKISIDDLTYVLDNTSNLFKEIRGEHIFITGGTGFFGCWLLESFLFANDKLKLDAKITVLTRDKEAFEKKAPHIAMHAAVALHTGDMTDFVFPTGGFSHIIHAASEVKDKTVIDDDQVAQIILNGTRRVLDFALQSKTSNFLLTSSGAVYGSGVANLNNIPEDYLLTQPDAPVLRDGYGNGKFLAENLCIEYANKFDVSVKIARCFAFIGPYLPLDKNFAVGNFILNGLKREAIHIKSDGTACRSYLYGADLVIWLWTILFRGQSCRPYNVGSDQAISIGELANIIANSFTPKLPIVIDKKPEYGKTAEKYIPSVQRIKQELGLGQHIDLLESIARTKNWYEVNI